MNLHLLTYKQQVFIEKDINASCSVYISLYIPPCVIIKIQSCLSCHQILPLNQEGVYQTNIFVFSDFSSRGRIWYQQLNRIVFGLIRFTLS